MHEMPDYLVPRIGQRKRQVQLKPTTYRYITANSPPGRKSTRLNPTFRAHAVSSSFCKFTIANAVSVNRATLSPCD
jgi:hypothetical protein